MPSSGVQPLPDQPPSLADLRDQRDAINHQIGALKRQGAAVDELVAQSKALTEQIKALEQQAAAPAEPRPAARPREYRCEVADTARAVTALRGEWQALAEASPDTHPFALWEWIEAWYQAYEALGDVVCLTVRRDDGQLVGVAPFFMPRGAPAGLRPGEIGFAGTYGRVWACHPRPLAWPGEEAAVAKALLARLQRLELPWQAVKLLRTDAESRILGEILGRAPTCGFRVYARPGLPSCFGPLPDDPEDVVAALPSSHLRARHRREAKRFAEIFPQARFRLVETREELAPLMARMAELSIEQWKDRARGSSFTEQAFGECLAAGFAQLLDSGYLRLLVLEVDGELAGAMAAILYRGQLHTVQPVTHPRYSEYGASHLVQVELMKRAVAEGARSCDMMVYYPYKAQYVSDIEQLIDVTVLPESARGTWELARELLERSARLVAKQVLRKR